MLHATLRIYFRYACYYRVDQSYSFIKCAIPVFEGLVDAPHNQIIREFLFELATWHGLAKLRLHTETTIDSLEHSTKRLGIAIWRFESETCSQFETKDLPSEDAAQARCQAVRLVKGKGKATREPAPSKESKTGPKIRKFNMETYKLHALGHYVDAIRRFGPSDGFSTQTVRN